MKNNNIAPMDELKLVQDIITAQENLCFKIFGWAIGIITAFTIGFHHKSVDFPPYIYIASGLFSIIAFFCVSRYHWITFAKAIERSYEIEKEMKDATYKSVRINETLRKDSELGLFVHYRLWLPYFVLVLIVILSGVSH